MNLSLFEENPGLLNKPYHVRTADDPVIFKQFIRAVMGKKIELTDQNVSVLTDLCSEFGFPPLLGRIEACMGKYPDAVHVFEIRKLRRIVREQSRTIEILRSFQVHASAELQSLRSELEALRRDVRGNSDGLSSVRHEFAALQAEVEEIRESTTPDSDSSEDTGTDTIGSEGLRRTFRPPRTSSGTGLSPPPPDRNQGGQSFFW